MSTTITETAPNSTYKLELRTAYGPVFREVSTAAPRECKVGEIPVIDISGIDGDIAAKTKLASEIKKAAEGTGFFYIKNHGIDEQIIQNAHDRALE